MKIIWLVALVGGLLLPACTTTTSDTSPGSCRYQFRSANESGTTIPVQERRPCSFVGTLLQGGGQYRLASDVGKVVVVNFWASWCGPCQSEAPQYDLLYRDEKAHGVDFVGVDTKDPVRSNAQSFVADHHISFPNVYDETGEVALQMGNVPVGGLPFTVLADSHGRIAAVYLGPQAPKDLKPTLRALSRGA